MKKILYLAVALSAASLTFTQCTKPTKDLSFNVNPEPFDYIVSLQFYDAAKLGAAPSDITLTIEGEQAANIYELSGTKNFKLSEGIIDLGLLYKANPTADAPANFTVIATCPGYLPVRIPISIEEGNHEMAIATSMISLSTPPPGVGVTEDNSFTLTNNANTSVISVATSSTTTDPSTSQKLNISIPAGTSFKDADGNTISGSTLKVQAVNFGTSDPAAINAFPGGGNGAGFTSNNVIDATGKIVSGTFQTAGFADIQMFVDGKEVKGFSQPIQMHMTLNNSDVNVTTGNPYAAGDVVSVYSYQTATGQWKYEQLGTVTVNGGVKEVTFQASHLTVWNLQPSSAIFPSCLKAVLRLKAEAVGTYLVDIYINKYATVPFYTGVVSITDTSLINIIGLQKVPYTLGDLNGVVKVYPLNSANSLSNYSKRYAIPYGSYFGPICGGNSVINVAAPTGTNSITYFDITGQCNNNNTQIRPTVNVYYRETGSGNTYELLGLVHHGNFATSNLAQGTSYDFMVTWNATVTKLKTKVVDSANYSRIVTVPSTENGNFCN